MQGATVHVTVDGEPRAFTLDFTGEHGKWTAPMDIEEGNFPLIAEYEGRRFELYSDGTFDEVELDR